jgi:hypothetical protein
MSEVVHSFTTTVPTWSPYVTPVELASATPEQLAAMKVTPSNKGVSPYVLTLAHDPESLAVRSPLFARRCSTSLCMARTACPRRSASSAR